MATETDRNGARDEAAQVAGGSGIVFAGGLADRGLRFANTWYLTWALGGASFGTYVYVVTVVTLTSRIASLGLDGALVFFGARHKALGERAELKGLVRIALGVGALAGLVATLSLALVAWSGRVWSSDDGVDQAMLIASPAALLGVLMYVGVGGLHGMKDMRGSMLAFQVGLPAAMLLGAVGTTLLGFGVQAVLAAYALAIGASVAALAIRGRRHFGPLFADRALRPVVSIGPLFRFAIPQSLASWIYELNRWMDLLMLSALGTLEQVGTYRVAVALALMGNLPSTAIITAFRPQISQMVYQERLQDLNALLQAATRWLVLFSAPVYLGIFLFPELLLKLFASEYLSAREPLLILAGAQFIHMLFSLTVPIIPMSGRATTSLVNGLLAVGVNVLLNWIWIPTHGMTGAAAASAVALALWALLFAVEVRAVLGCHAISRRNLELIALTVLVAGLGLRLGQDLALRLAIYALGLVALGTLVWVRGSTPEDNSALEHVRHKVRALLGR